MNGGVRIALLGLLFTWGVWAWAQDEVAEGEKAFEAQCASCHTVKQGVNGFGLSLAGVVRRPAGKAPGYQYSALN